MEILVVMVSIVAMESIVFADNYGFYGNYQNCGKSGKCGNYKARGVVSGSPVICLKRVHIWGELFIWYISINIYLEYLGKK